jgi:RNA polymerase sigma factor (sigma-70 family)
MRPTDLARQVEDRELIQKLLADFPPRYQLAFTLRFGLDGSSEMTFEEVAEVLGVTRERVRQMIITRLWRARHKVRSLGFRFFEDL